MHTGQTIVATLCAVHCTWHCRLRTTQGRLCVLGRSTCPCQRRAVLSRHDRGRLERSHRDGQCTFVTGSRREIHLRARTSHAHRPGMSLRSARRYRRLVCGKPAQTRPGLAWHNSGRRSRGDRRGERCATDVSVRNVFVHPHFTDRLCTAVRLLAWHLSLKSCSIIVFIFRRHCSTIMCHRLRHACDRNYLVACG